MKLRLMALSVVALAAAAVPATATTTITFTALTNSGYYVDANPYSESGFTFSSSNGASSSLIAWGNSSFNADPGGATLVNNFGAQTTTFVQIGGGTFDFNSIDLADVYNNGSNGDVQFAFTDGMGTTYQTVSLDSLVGLQTFTFNKTALLSVSYNPLTTQGQWIQADNVVLNAAVPEPASWALMIVGFGMVGGALRSRRKVALTA